MRTRVKLLVAAAIASGILLAAPILLRPALALPGNAEPPPCVLAPGLEQDPPANAACIVDDGDRLLLVRTLRSGNRGLPGGRPWPGEFSQCTAHRETWEETGILVEVGSLIATTGPRWAQDARVPSVPESRAIGRSKHPHGKTQRRADSAIRVSAFV